MWSHLNGKKMEKKCLLQHQILRIGFHLSRKHPSPKNQILPRYISITHNSGKKKKKKRHRCSYSSACPVDAELEPQNCTSHMAVHKVARGKYRSRIFNPKPCYSAALDYYNSKLILPIKGMGKSGYRSKLHPCLATPNQSGFYPSLITEHL